MAKSRLKSRPKSRLIVDQSTKEERFIILEDYKINSVTSGRDAQGEVITKVRYKGKMFIGNGVSVDIIEASARSYVNGINKALNYEKKYS